MIKFFFIAVCFIFCKQGIAQNVVINEAMAANAASGIDEDGSAEDWLELYNGSPDVVSLNGYGLSDDIALPFKWVFPDVSIAPGGFILIWCSDKNRTAIDAPLHTNFKVSDEGETLILTAPGGFTTDTVIVPALPTDVSYGREMDGDAALVYFGLPTPAASNNASTAYDSVLPAPVFSTGSGFFDSPFNLTLSTEAAGASIIYTLDGSDPDENNLSGKTYQYKNVYPEFPLGITGEILEKNYSSNLYSDPIPIGDRNGEPNKISEISTTYSAFPYYIPVTIIPKGSVVRAKVVRLGALPSEVKTCNYFVSADGSNDFSLPVVAISTSDDKLFDYEDGINVAGKDFDDWRTSNPLGNAETSTANYTRTGITAEVKVNVSYFVNQQEKLNQTAGIRIQGAQSRIFPNKSWRIYARSEYGKSTLDYSFFPDSAYNSFKRIILRNSGVDTYYTMFRDAFVQTAVKHLHFQTQRYQPSVMFVNSEFWGIFNLRESYDEHYFERVFDIAENELDFLKAHGYIVENGSNEHYFAMLDYIDTHPMEQAESYAYVGTQMDIENYIDYYITNIYGANTDWPHNNIEYWRKHTAGFQPNAAYGHDGRWRWVLNDTDFAFGGSMLPDAVNVDMLAQTTSLLGVNDAEWPNKLFRGLLQNNEFKLAFITRFADLINTTFKPERLTGIIQQMKSVIEPEMPRHILRWPLISSMEIWQTNVAFMESFATLRPEIQRAQILQKFNIPSTIPVLLDTNDTQGFIKINTIDITSSTPGVAANPYPWAGIYFENIPVTLSAIPLPGYQFSHWSGASSSTNPEITLVPNTSNDFSITAHFIAAGNPTGVVPIYFWMVDNSVANDTPLTSVDASYETDGQAWLEFRSALDGYPFTPEHANWRKASMERRNSPTEINYLPEANNGEAFADSEMRGLQIKQPFQDNDRENTMVFHLPTDGYKDIKVAFAAKNENAADALLLDYSISADEQWITTGLPVTVLPLSGSYQLYQADFSAIASVNHNPDFKVRLRFSGANMTIDNGDRVTFNNVSVTGVPESLGLTQDTASQFYIYPNPASETLYINNSDNQSFDYRISTIDGRIVGSGAAISEIALTSLSSGIYLLELTSGNLRVKKKFSKN